MHVKDILEHFGTASYFHTRTVLVTVFHTRVLTVLTVCFLSTPVLGGRVPRFE